MCSSPAIWCLAWASRATLRNSVRFLASDRSSYITAQDYRVDGGFLSHVPSLAPLRDLMAQMQQG